MTNPLKTSAAANLGLLLGRIPLGATFLMAGLMKFNKIGLKAFVDMSTSHLPAFLPKPIGQTYLYAVPFFEIAVGLSLILGLFTRSFAVIASLMLISFTIAITGVFTDGNWYAVNFNIVYLGLAILLATTGPGLISLDRAFFGSSHSPRH